MKEVRFNDKLWFGKHKGARVSDLIKGDPNYIQKLIKEGAITLDTKSKNYFEERCGIQDKKKNPYGFNPNRYGIAPGNAPYGVPANELRQVSARGQFEGANLRGTLRTIIIEVFRDRNVDQDLIDWATTNFYNKIAPLNIGNTVVELRMLATPDNNVGLRPFRHDDLNLFIIDPNNGNQLISFDLR